MPLPEKWKHSYIGRKVIHPRTPGITGVVKYARIMRHSIPDGGATECRLSLAFSVEWSDGTTEVVDDAGVASIATDEFVDQPWMLKAVLDIQKSTEATTRTPKGIGHKERKEKETHPAKSDEVFSAAADAVSESNEVKSATESLPGQSDQPPAILLVADDKSEEKASKVAPQALEMELLIPEEPVVKAETSPGQAFKENKDDVRIRPSLSILVEPTGTKSMLATNPKVPPPAEAYKSPGMSEPQEQSAHRPMEVEEIIEILDDTTDSDAHDNDDSAITQSSCVEQERSQLAMHGHMHMADSYSRRVNLWETEEVGSRKRKRSKILIAVQESVLLNSSFLNAKIPKSARVGETKERVFQFDEVVVEGTRYRIYSSDLIIASQVCFKDKGSDGSPPDLSVNAWKVNGEYDHSEEYLVDCIAAERHVGPGNSHTEFLMKYTGFEIDIGDAYWRPLSEVEELEAYDVWLDRGKRGWEEGCRRVKAAAGFCKGMERKNDRQASSGRDRL